MAGGLGEQGRGRGLLGGNPVSRHQGWGSAEPDQLWGRDRVEDLRSFCYIVLS